MNKRFQFVALTIAFLFAIGSASAVLGSSATKIKRPKNTGILSIKTSPDSYPVMIDGVQVGMSGVGTGAEFYVSPGTHKLEVTGPNGKSFAKDVDIVKDVRNCVCLKMISDVIKRPCPYDIRVDAPSSVAEGDLVTFAAFNAVTEGSSALNYVWRVTPETARITSGIGTPSITVDTSGLGGETITAALEVSDGSNFDTTCRQNVAAKTQVERPVKPEAFRFDSFESRSFDDDKARLDGLVIELQNRPDSQAYIVLFQGTEGKRRMNIDVLAKRSLDYLVKTRGVDPRRIQITKLGKRPRTGYEFWIVPPGAAPPLPQ